LAGYPGRGDHGFHAAGGPVEHAPEILYSIQPAFFFHVEAQ
jgi:hypothetical protein